MIAAGISLGLLGVLFLGAGIAAGRARRWRCGAPARVDLWAGLRDLPKRYLVDVHHVVARKPYNARFHALAAGGLLASLPLLLLAGLPALNARWLWGVIALCLLTGLVGSVMAALRRTLNRSPELSTGAWQRFPLMLAGFAITMLLVALDQAAGGKLPPVVTACLALIGLLAFADLVLGVGRGPLRHAFAGGIHLVVHPRPERFKRAGTAPEARPTAVRPIDLEADRLGVETPSDFAWNRLASFDACVQCGRCETVCPAYDAGLPLNPKALIQDLVRSAEITGPAYTGNPHPGVGQDIPKGGMTTPIIADDGSIRPETLWACTTCRACVEACPMLIEHVDAVLDLRRFQTLHEGATYGKGAEALEELRATDNTRGLAAERRIDWASDLSLPVLDEGGECDLLLWLGDGAFDLRGQRTLRALIGLLRRAGADFAILGTAERDSGDLARRLGDEATFQALAHQNIATLSALKFGRILTADPHALHVLRNEYPAFGGQFEVVHHTALILELVEAGRLTLPDLKGASVTYHDPCYLGRYNGEYDAPRRLLEIAGADLTEMARSGPTSHCCGGGGGAPQTDVPGKARIPDRRMDQARETGASCVAVACPGCANMLEGVPIPRPEIRDIAELLAELAP